jgi:copine 5/8/9
VYDWEKSGKHRCLGVAKVTVDGLLQGSKRLSLEHPSTGKVTKAEILFESMRLVERTSFLDFLKGGLQIGFTCAIDFTASNKAPGDPKSLHNLAQSPNQYEAAIQAVGNIVEFYNPGRYDSATAPLATRVATRKSFLPTLFSCRQSHIQ